MKKTVFLLAGLFVMACGIQSVKAQTASASAKATIITPIAIAQVADLNFGNIVAGTTPGTVTVNHDGIRTKSDGVTLPTATPGSGTITAAKFNISGLPSATYSITLPTEEATITKEGGSETMTVSNFTSYPSVSDGGTLTTDGTQILAVGATLNVGANQSAGTYEGSFSVTVAYN